MFKKWKKNQKIKLILKDKNEILEITFFSGKWKKISENGKLILEKWLKTYIQHTQTPTLVINKLNPKLYLHYYANKYTDDPRSK